MSKQEDRFELHARHHLEALGYRVSRIAESEQVGEERADYRADREAESLVVEVKGREIPDKIRQLRQHAMVRGSSHLTRSLARRSTLDGVLAKAEGQLTSTPAASASLRAAWISLLEDEHFAMSELMATAFGLQTLALHTADGAFARTSECFYYHPASLHRLRGLDAIVLCGTESFSLCVNEFSGRSDLIVESALGRHCHKAGLVEPHRIEEHNAAIAIRTHRLLRSDTARHAYIQEHYGFLSSCMSESEFTGVLSCSSTERQDAAS